MRKRFTTVVVLTSAALALCVGIANAVVQTNGNGQTHLSASLGFNAKADLRGELNYNSDDGTFAAHCSGYTRYSEAITAYFDWWLLFRHGLAQGIRGAIYEPVWLLGVLALVMISAKPSPIVSNARA